MSSLQDLAPLCLETLRLFSLTPSEATEALISCHLLQLSPTAAEQRAAAHLCHLQTQQVTVDIARSRSCSSDYNPENQTNEEDFQIHAFHRYREGDGEKKEKRG